MKTLFCEGWSMRARLFFFGIIVLTFAVAGFIRLQDELKDRLISSATSPDGSWSVALIGKWKLTGWYELFVEVRDRRGALPRGGAFVVGYANDLDAAKQTHAVQFHGNEVARVADWTLEKARYFGK